MTASAVTDKSHVNKCLSGVHANTLEVKGRAVKQMPNNAL